MTVENRGYYYSLTYYLFQQKNESLTCTPPIGSIPSPTLFSSSSLSFPPPSCSPAGNIHGRRHPAPPPIPLHLPNSINLFSFGAVSSLYDSLLHFRFLVFFSVFVSVVFDVSLKLVWLHLQRYWSSREREDGKSKRCLSKEYFRRRRGEPRNQGRLENQFRLPDLCMFLLEFFLIHFISLSLTLGCSYLPPLY